MVAILFILFGGRFWWSTIASPFVVHSRPSVCLLGVAQGHSGLFPPHCSSCPPSRLSSLHASKQGTCPSCVHPTIIAGLYCWVILAFYHHFVPREAKFLDPVSWIQFVPHSWCPSVYGVCCSLCGVRLSLRGGAYLVYACRPSLGVRHFPCDARLLGVRHFPCDTRLLGVRHSPCDVRYASWRRAIPISTLM